MSRLLVLFLLTSCATLSGAPATPRAPFEVKVVGKGPPMILIPGLASSGEVWDQVVAHYQQDHECHVLTLAGFAGQPPLRESLLPAAHAGLVAYLREHQLEAPVVVGHSLGGFLGLWLASTNPELVGKLVIVDSAPSLAALQAPSITPLEAAQQADALRTALRMSQPDERARQARATAKMMTSSQAQADRVAKWTMASDPDTVADAAYYVMTHDLRSELSKVQTQTLVVGTWIEYRPYLTRADMLERFTQQYEGCRTCKVQLNDHAKHFVMLDDPAGLLSQVDAFLSTSVVQAR